MDSAIMSGVRYDTVAREYVVCKRALSIIASLVLLVFLSWVFLLIAVLLKIFHPDVPVFISVPVIGKDGKPFRMWKFSTMVADAHIILEKLLASDPKLREEWETTVKLQNDPRILGKVGRLLRKSSLNELPQLYNVLRGDMSLVGPRPITAREAPLYIEYGGSEMLRLRHSIRPGITGLWQVSGRSDISYEERVALDKTYCQAASLSTDLRISLLTVWHVFRGTGAA
jgi:exopolysaccharide production protein ExoY